MTPIMGGGRDLCLQCLQADPQYAPAWARLGRVYHVIGKWTSEDCPKRGRAEPCARLNPNLSIADRFYAQLEVGTGRHMKDDRLVNRSCHAAASGSLCGARACLPVLRPAAASRSRRTSARRASIERQDSVSTPSSYSAIICARTSRAIVVTGKHWA